MIKVFICGSCVSRDALEVEGNDNFELVHYGARCSLATLAFPDVIENINLDNISSPFQKRMVNDDIHRNILKYIGDKDFDFLLMDFIDERDGLVNIENKGWLTNSAELKSTGYEEKGSFNRIISGSEIHLQKFLDGFNILYQKLLLLKKEDKMLINKVFWSTHKDNGETVSPTINYIKEANAFLTKIYDYLALNFPSLKFIEYEKSSLVAKSDHKWGVAAFHYVDKFYVETLEKLNQIYLSDIFINEMKINLINNELIFNAHVVHNENKSIDFAAYLFKDGRKVDQLLYRKESSFKFGYRGQGEYKVRLFCRYKNSKNLKIMFSPAFYF
jgi:hypothetical protein